MDNTWAYANVYSKEQRQINRPWTENLNSIEYFKNTEPTSGRGVEIYLLTDDNSLVQEIILNKNFSLAPESVTIAFDKLERLRSALSEGINATIQLKRLVAINLSSPIPNPEFESLLDYCNSQDISVITTEKMLLSYPAFDLSHVIVVAPAGQDKKPLVATKTIFLAPGVSSAPDCSAVAFTTGIIAAFVSKIKNVTTVEIKNYLQQSALKIQGNQTDKQQSDHDETQHLHLKRLPQAFIPQWSVLEENFIAAFPHDKEIDYQLKCSSPFKGQVEFEVTGGFLPDGVTLSKTGKLSGLPKINTAADHINYFSIVVRATNHCGESIRHLSFIISGLAETAANSRKHTALVEMAKVCNSYADAEPGDTWSDGWNTPYVYDCCFSSDSKVLRADGTLCDISELKQGDLIMQPNGTARLAAVLSVPLGDRFLYQLNNEKIYLTSEHPLIGSDGEIYSIDPELTEKIIHVKAKKIEIGTEFKTISGSKIVTTIKQLKRPSKERVYNLYVENEGTYFVSGFLSHRKHLDTSLLQRLPTFSNQPQPS